MVTLTWVTLMWVILTRVVTSLAVTIRVAANWLIGGALIDTRVTAI